MVISDTILEQYQQSEHLGNEVITKGGGPRQITTQVYRPHSTIQSKQNRIEQKPKTYEQKYRRIHEERRGIETEREIKARPE